MNVAAILEEYGIEGELKNGEFLTLCPYHRDTNPSCSINLEKEKFRCFSCDAKGSFINFLATVTKTSRAVIRRHLEGTKNFTSDISMKLILKWNETLLNSKASLNHLAKKGISLKTVKEFHLGYDGKRITIPIPNGNGDIIDVRRWLPSAKTKKMLSIKGHGGSMLFPFKHLESKIVIITEGELKALLFRELGFFAVSATSGSGTWLDEWGVFFKDKKVFLCYDLDRAGFIGAQKAAQSVYRYTSEIFKIVLPLDRKKYPKGDITNYVVDEKQTDIKALMKKAEKWEPLIEQEKFDDKIHKVSLHSCTKAKYFDKIIETKVVVSAKDTAPFIVPQHVKVSCSKDQEVCAFCSCLKQSEFKIPKTHPVILELVNTSTKGQAQAIRKIAKIPKSCKSSFFTILKAMNVEEIRLIPQISISNNDSEHAVRKGFFIGHGLETNADYKIRARVTVQPDTQHATLVIYEAEPAIDNLSVFSLKTNLKRFQPKEWTIKSIDKKLKEIYLDLECNVTKIYQRSNLHFFYDLCYHSVLYVPFQGQKIKGWVEGLVVGDSGQGKSETSIQLQKHYKLGERIDVKSCSIAGLIGGLQETAKRWFITWGIIPLNDKRLVVLEEVKGIPQEVIGKLTEVRSSGVAEISKVEKSRTNARVRLIWVSNPRTDRQVLSYNFGVEAIKELIGNLEDIRRFDFAIVLTSSDVDKKWINMALSERPKVDHLYTSELCQQLILWGWSRKPEQIIMTPDATKEILKQASNMGSKYTSRIPLVESADQRLKLARLSTALAVRTFSTEDNEKIIVRKCHVEYVAKFLEDTYSSGAFGYLDYSNMIKRETTIGEKDEIIARLKNLPFAKSVVEAFLNTQIISVFDIIDWTGGEIDDCRSLVGLLVRNNAIKRSGRGYSKNQAFIALLKALKMEDLENETSFTKASKEEF